jgi:hypothetical protein
MSRGLYLSVLRKFMHDGAVFQVHSVMARTHSALRSDLYISAGVELNAMGQGQDQSRSPLMPDVGPSGAERSSVCPPELAIKAVELAAGTEKVKIFEKWYAETKIYGGKDPLYNTWKFYKEQITQNHGHDMNQYETYDTMKIATAARGVDRGAVGG